MDQHDQKQHRQLPKHLYYGIRLLNLLNLLLYQNIDYYYLTKNSESTKFLFDIINNQSNIDQTEDENFEKK